MNAADIQRNIEVANDCPNDCDGGVLDTGAEMLGGAGVRKVQLAGTGGRSAFMVEAIA